MQSSYHAGWASFRASSQTVTRLSLCARCFTKLPSIILPSWLPLFFSERLQELRFQMVTLPIVKQKKKKSWYAVGKRSVIVVVGREVGILFPRVFGSVSSYSNHHISLLQLYLCLWSAFLISPMFKHMKDAGIREVTIDIPSPWFWWHSSQLLIFIAKIYGDVEIETNSLLSNTEMWWLFRLLPGCPVMLSYVFKENFSWAITCLCYASCSFQKLVSEK